MYQPFITSCNQPLSNNLVKCVLPISFVPCNTTQGCCSWSLRNSSSETAIFSAIVAIVFLLNTFLYVQILVFENVQQLVFVYVHLLVFDAKIQNVFI